MVIHRLETTVEAFEEFVTLPENADRLFEFIAGEIVEVPSHPLASKLACNAALEVGRFIKHEKLGHVTGEAGGYAVAGERYLPNMAYISYHHQPKLADSGYNPNPPDLAVEVEFPTTVQSERRLRAKILNYLSVETMVWVVYPETQEIEIYAPGKPVQILGIDDTLDGGEVLPGFTMPVKVVFED